MEKHSKVWSEQFLVWNPQKPQMDMKVLKVVSESPNSLLQASHLLLTSQLNSMKMNIWKQMFQIIRPSSEVIWTVKSGEDP